MVSDWWKSSNLPAAKVIRKISKPVPPVKKSDVRSDDKPVSVKKTRSVPSNIKDLPVGKVIEDVVIPETQKKAEEIAKSDLPRVVSGRQIRRGAGHGLVDIQKNISSIDPDVTYIYNNEEILGSELRSRFKQQNIGNVVNLFRLGRTPSGEYIAKKNQYYPVGSELKYVMEKSEPGFKKKLISDIGSSKFEETFQKAYGSLSDVEKEKYHSRFNKDYISEQQRIKNKMDELRSFYDRPSVEGFLHTWSTGLLSWEDFLGSKSLYYTLTGNREKVIETKARASLDLDASLKEGVSFFAVKSITGPFGTIGLTYASGAALGAGFGSLKTILPHAGKIAETLFAVETGIIGVKEAYPRFKKNIDDKKFANIISDIVIIGTLGYSGYRGYKTGSIFGQGRTSEYLDRIHTYEPGSVGDIRFKSALKVARRLEVVRSHKMKPLDIARDIARMDARSAARTIEFLRRNPRTTIGGSAASFTQIEGARIPQDIDLLLPYNQKNVIAAKQFFKNTKTKIGKHLIDIHGKKFFKPGQHHLFGFRSKTPIKIGNYKFFRAGEQLFRKAVSSVRKETSYRHFKDIPDFITHARSLIKSSKYSKNPIVRMKGFSAEKHLSRYLNPIEKINIKSSFNKTIKSFTKKPFVKRKFYLDVNKRGVGYSEYIDPSKGYYPTGGIYGFATYSKYKKLDNKLRMKAYNVKAPQINKYIIIKSPNIRSVQVYKPKIPELSQIKINVKPITYPTGYKPDIPINKLGYVKTPYKQKPYGFYPSIKPPSIMIKKKKKTRDLFIIPSVDLFEGARKRTHPVKLLFEGLF